MNTSIHHGHIAGHVLAYAAARCRTINAALALMHVLPAYEQPDTFNAILARGFRELAPRRALHLAVQYGHTKPVEMYPESVVFSEAWSLAQAAAKFGNVKSLSKYLYAWYGKEEIDETLFRLALLAGRVSVLDWFRMEGCFHRNMTSECFHDQKYDLECLKWAKSHGYLEFSAQQLVLAGLEQNQLDVVEWANAGEPNDAFLREIFDSEDFVHDITGFQREGLEWWWARLPRFPTPKELLDIVHARIEAGSLPAVEWWWETFLAHCTDTHRFASTGAIRDVIN
ncbi:hypothetical protein BC828DRAFT_397074 [Blastocladiella britannica]|nr:hypothetical protein BC828DRAFT_397074 [Blastocladiella britannica]